MRTFSRSSDGEAVRRLSLLRERAVLVSKSLSTGEKVERRMRTCVVGERMPPLSTHAGSTVDKGKEIHICIRRKDGSLLPEEESTYVFLHEIAHVMSSSVGHTSEFEKNISLLLEEAVRLGFLPHDRPPLRYCT